MVSVIVTVYNVEKYLAKCIESILAQSYSDLELILVNDASPDGSLKIMEEYAKIDDRIRIVSYEKNKGLFHARLEGYKVAKGEYLCFVDSDDTVSVDWIRLLEEKIKTEDADMVLGNTVQVRGGARNIDNNYMSLTRNRPALIGTDGMDALMSDEGLNFAWHTVWNKIYKKSLWDRAFPSLQKMEGHLIMAEDVAFSTVLYFYSQKLAFSDHDCYYYFRHDEASTSATISLDRVRKNILDVARVFDFCEAFLKEQNVFDKYEKSFTNFKDRNFRIYCNILAYRKLDRNKQFVSMTLNAFKKDKLELSHDDDFYFYEYITPHQENQEYEEQLKEKICGEYVDIVSFDVFDTLIVRPFMSPAKMIEFYVKKYAKYLKEQGIESFQAKRSEAERVCRGKVAKEHPGYEDCTIDEIYREFGKLFSVPEDVCEQLKQYELDTELELCSQRREVAEFLRLAKHVGKRVILVSDMYYPADFMRKLLEKNGITQYDALFVSSEARKLKVTGTLYDAVKEAYPGARILHIGDNYDSDVKAAENKKLGAFYVPSPRDTFSGKARRCAAPNAYPDRCCKNTGFVSVEEAMKQLPIDAAHGVAAIQSFAKPFATWNSDLRYNADFYFIGNYVFGTEMLGISAWLDRVCRENGYRKVVFLARDGYVPKKAFDIYVKERGLDIETEYFPVSRRAVLSFDIEKCGSLSCVAKYINYADHSVLSLTDLIADYLTDKEKALDALKREKINTVEKISGDLAFGEAVAVLDTFLDTDALARSNAEIRECYKQVFSDGTVAFDLGYSGRIQSMISYIAGKPVDVCFLHSNGIEAEERAKLDGYRIHNFMDYTPQITSIVREYFFSELVGSCTGYDVRDGKLIPRYDGTEHHYIEHYMQEEIIRGMEEFVRGYCKTFAPYDFMFAFRNSEISLPFEVFLHECPDKDTRPFRIAKIEDKCYSNYEEMNLETVWKYHLGRRAATSGGGGAGRVIEVDKKIVSTYQFTRTPRWKRIIIMMLVDKPYFRSKLAKYFGRKRKKK